MWKFGSKQNFGRGKKGFLHKTWCVHLVRFSSRVLCSGGRLGEDWLLECSCSLVSQTENVVAAAAAFTYRLPGFYRTREIPTTWAKSAESLWCFQERTAAAAHKFLREVIENLLVHDYTTRLRHAFCSFRCGRRERIQCLFFILSCHKARSIDK